MQKLNIVIPAAFAWLSDSILSSCTTTLNIEPNIAIVPDIDSAFGDENTDVLCMPYHLCEYDLPSEGLLITALSKRINPSFAIAIKKSIKTLDAEALLGIPHNTTIFATNNVLAKLLSEVFTANTIELIAESTLATTVQEKDVVVLPMAFCALLNLAEYDFQELHYSEFPPQAGAGVLAWITRAEDVAIRRLLKPLHHSETNTIVKAERLLAKQWQKEGVQGLAYCEKDTYGYYHLHTVKMIGQDVIVKDKKSSSTVLFS